MKAELLKKYDMKTLEEYKLIFGETKDTEITFYQTFLMKTDYIPNKIMESKILNIECKDYTEELNTREFCRQQIRKLAV